LAQGASGNAQGGFYPQLNAVAGVSSQIHATAFTYAKRLYEELLVNGQDFAHQWCGTLQIAFNDKVTARQQKMMNNNTWPPSFIHQLDAQQASAVAKVSLPYSGLFIPSAGWINLPQLVQALCQAAKSQIACDKRLTQLNPQGEGWQIDWHDGSHTQADIVILAMGSDSLACQQLADVPFRLVRGQVESIASQGELTQLDTVLCHKGYMTPAWQGQHALGSTYIKQDKSCEYRLSEQQLNLGMHQQALIHCDWAQQMQTQSTGRAAIRCSTPDHLPIVGAVADFAKQKSQYQDLYKALPAAHYPAPSDHPNLFVLSGLGSRGLSTAPLCAEILISQILGQPVPLANDLLDALSPNRFLIKGLIRRTL
jgi:tRNA 5-methylaminomethyl-2-thiouridine biosynthesis bifunctional protein